MPLTHPTEEASRVLPPIPLPNVVRIRGSPVAGWAAVGPWNTAHFGGAQLGLTWRGPTISLLPPLRLSLRARSRATLLGRL